LPEALEGNKKAQRRQAGRTLYFQAGASSGTAKLILTKNKNPSTKSQIPKPTAGLARSFGGKLKNATPTGGAD